FCPVLLCGAHRPVHGADDALGDGTRQAQGGADGDDLITHDGFVGVTEIQGFHVLGGVQFEHGQVVFGFGPHHGGVGGASVAVLDADAFLHLFGDVVVGDHVVVRDHKTGTAGGHTRTRTEDVHHARTDPLGDTRDGVGGAIGLRRRRDVHGLGFGFGLIRLLGRIAEEDTRKTTGTARDQSHDEHARQGHPRRDATTAPWGLCLRRAVDLSVGGGPRGHRGRGTVSARGRWWVPRWGLGRAGGAGRVGGWDGGHGGSAAWGCGTGVRGSVPWVLGAG